MVHESSVSHVRSAQRILAFSREGIGSEDKTTTERRAADEEQAVSVRDMTSHRLTQDHPNLSRAAVKRAKTVSKVELAVLSAEEFMHNQNRENFSLAFSLLSELSDDDTDLAISCLKSETLNGLAAFPHLAPKQVQSGEGIQSMHAKEQNDHQRTHCKDDEIHSTVLLERICHLEAENEKLITSYFSSQCQLKELQSELSRLQGKASTAHNCITKKTCNKSSNQGTSCINDVEEILLAMFQFWVNLHELPQLAQETAQLLAREERMLDAVKEVHARCEALIAASSQEVEKEEEEKDKEARSDVEEPEGEKERGRGSSIGGGRGLGSERGREDAGWRERALALAMTSRRRQERGRALERGWRALRAQAARARVSHVLSNVRGLLRAEQTSGCPIMPGGEGPSRASVDVDMGHGWRECRLGMGHSRTVSVEEGTTAPGRVVAASQAVQTDDQADVTWETTTSTMSTHNIAADSFSAAHKEGKPGIETPSAGATVEGGWRKEWRERALEYAGACREQRARWERWVCVGELRSVLEEQEESVRRGK
eukprot:547775-Rhodomonas_salina.1